MMVVKFQEILFDFFYCIMKYYAAVILSSDSLYMPLYHIRILSKSIKPFLTNFFSIFNIFLFSRKHIELEIWKRNLVFYQYLHISKAAIKCSQRAILPRLSPYAFSNLVLLNSTKPQNSKKISGKFAVCK